MSYGRKGHPAWETLRKYRYAHRGYHDKPSVPENSMPAFERAIERGWGAELDVHLLKDGGLAVFHDSDLKRCTGAKGFIEDLNSAELSKLRLEGTNERVPMLNEVLEIFRGRAPLIIELKCFRENHTALAEAVCKCLDGYWGDFCVESFDPRAVREIRFLRPYICRGQLACNFFRMDETMLLWQRFALTNLLFNAVTVPDFVAYRFEDRQDRSIRRCAASGIQEINWTVRSKADMALCEADGALVIFECFDPDE